MIGHKITSDELDGVSAHTGFPNPALDSSLDSLDLNRHLIKHPAGSYFMRISGNNWKDQGIFDGDIAIIDRVISPSTNDLVIWWEGESFVIGPRHKLPLDIPQWGTVTTIIHTYKKCEGVE